MRLVWSLNGDDVCTVERYRIVFFVVHHHWRNTTVAGGVLKMFVYMQCVHRKLWGTFSLASWSVYICTVLDV
jgi:hypothetical protein